MDRGMERGRLEGERHASKEGIFDVLLARFEDVPDRLLQRIMQEQDVLLLKHLLRFAAIVDSLEEFEGKLPSGQ